MVRNKQLYIIIVVVTYVIMITYLRHRVTLAHRRHVEHRQHVEDPLSPFAFANPFANDTRVLSSRMRIPLWSASRTPIAYYTDLSYRGETSIRRLACYRRFLSYFVLFVSLTSLERIVTRIKKIRSANAPDQYDRLGRLVRSVGSSFNIRLIPVIFCTLRGALVLYVRSAIVVRYSTRELSSTASRYAIAQRAEGRVSIACRESSK